MTITILFRSLDRCQVSIWDTPAQLSGFLPLPVSPVKALDHKETLVIYHFEIQIMYNMLTNVNIGITGNRRVAFTTLEGATTIDVQLYS